MLGLGALQLSSGAVALGFGKRARAGVEQRGADRINHGDDGLGGGDLGAGFERNAADLSGDGCGDDVLAEPAPPSDLPFATGSWRFARGLAYARKGDFAKADEELATLRAVASATPPERTVQIVNRAKDILDVQIEVLAGEIASDRGRHGEAVGHLERAVALQDELRYMEPPPFFYPVRQSLGAALLAAGRPADAEAAYVADLKRNPDNGWSLYGLEQSLRAQGRDADAAAVQKRFADAWSRADVQLAASRF